MYTDYDNYEKFDREVVVPASNIMLAQYKDQNTTSILVAGLGWGRLKLPLEVAKKILMDAVENKVSVLDLNTYAMTTADSKAEYEARQAAKDAAAQKRKGPLSRIFG